MMPSLSGEGVDIKVGWLDGERLFQLKFVLRVVEDKVEFLKNHRERDNGFLPRERPPL